MKKLLILVLIAASTALAQAGVSDSSSVIVRLEFSTLYSYGLPHSIGLVPKMIVSGKKTDVGLGLVFQQKVFPNPDIVSPGEYSSFISGLYAFYNRRINKNDNNALSLQYRVLLQQAVVFQLNEVKYMETARLVNTLDQAVGYSFRKKIINKLYFTQGTGVGVITHLNGYQGTRNAIRFGNSNFGLSGMIDFGLMYDIR